MLSENPIIKCFNISNADKNEFDFKQILTTAADQSCKSKVKRVIDTYREISLKMKNK